MKEAASALTLILLFSSTMSFSRKERLQPEQVVIVSDEKDKKIPSGYFVIEGSVKMFSSLSPLDNVLIGCTSSGIWKRSDKDGNFEIQLKISDSTVYFYKEGWSEIVMEDYTFKDQHRIKIDAYMWNASSNDVKRKPVIYLYSEAEIEVDLKLDPKGEFTFTYPDYNNGWKAQVNKDGIKVDEKSYPYLFWEAESKEKMLYSMNNGKLPGFQIETKNAISFLEEKLDQIGLNQTERTDFITYWGPILAKKDYAFVQFWVDEEYEAQVAEIDITPKPNSMKRVYIMCSNLDAPLDQFEIIPQDLTSFERIGFTVVEWGGSVIDLNNISP